MDDQVIRDFDSKSAEAGATGEFPKEWTPQDSCVHTVHVQEGSQQWKGVEDCVKKTMPDTTILELIRIQNTWLWERYAVQKSRMHAKNNGVVNELQLFHGTKDVPAQICLDEAKKQKEVGKLPPLSQKSHQLVQHRVLC